MESHEHLTSLGVFCVVTGISDPQKDHNYLGTWNKIYGKNVWVFSLNEPILLSDIESGYLEVDFDDLIESEGKIMGWYSSARGKYEKVNY